MQHCPSARQRISIRPFRDHFMVSIFIIRRQWPLRYPVRQKGRTITRSAIFIIRPSVIRSSEFRKLYGSEVILDIFLFLVQDFLMRRPPEVVSSALRAPAQRTPPRRVPLAAKPKNSPARPSPLQDPRQSLERAAEFPLGEVVLDHPHHEQIADPEARDEKAPRVRRTRVGQAGVEDPAPGERNQEGDGVGEGGCQGNDADRRQQEPRHDEELLQHLHEREVAVVLLVALTQHAVRVWADDAGDERGERQRQWVREHHGVT